MILEVFENIFKICPFRRANLNSVGLGGINTSLPLLANELSDIDTEGEYFKELCHDYVCKQMIDKELSDFIERNTQDQSDCSLWKELHNGHLISSVFGEIFN